MDAWGFQGTENVHKDADFKRASSDNWLVFQNYPTKVGDTGFCLVFFGLGFSVFRIWIGFGFTDLDLIGFGFLDIA